MINKKANSIQIFFSIMFCFFSIVTPAAHASINLNQHLWSLSNRYPELDKNLLKYGLTAFSHAEDKNILKKQILSLIDYSKPSNEKRLWVIDLKTDKVIFRDYVSHGQNTGNIYARNFSNTPGSHQSSYGVFLTDQTYSGSHGLSLRLKGLEKGINDMAEKRAIVVHGASYASQQFAEHYGRIGRSWGCFAINQNIVKPIINTIKMGSLFVAYYPNKYWLTHSSFLN